MKAESKGRAGFDAVYAEYKDLILQIAVKNTKSLHDAEDIVQEAFFRYYICSAHKEIKNTKAWLAVTANNLAINHVKHAQYEILLNEDEEMELLMKRELGAEDNFFDNMWKRDIIVYTDKVLKAVSQRNKRWYDALTYAYCMKMPRQEIADSMGITLDALQSILLRAKNWIRKNYKEEFDYITRA